MDFSDVLQAFAISKGEAEANEREINPAYEARVVALTDAARIAEYLGHPDVRDAILQLAAATSQTRTEEIRFRAPSDQRGKSVSAVEKSTSKPANSASASGDVNFRDPEMHCPVGLRCPYLANDLADDKPIALIRLASQPADREAGATFDEVQAHLRSKDVSQWFEDMPTERIYQETHANLQGAPLDNLKRRITKRGPYLHSMGAIPMLAKEVGDRWKADEPARVGAEQLRRSSEFQRVREAALMHRDQLHIAWLNLQQVGG